MSKKKDMNLKNMKFENMNTKDTATLEAIAYEKKMDKLREADNTSLGQAEKGLEDLVADDNSSLNQIIRFAEEQIEERKFDEELRYEDVEFDFDGELMTTEQFEVEEQQPVKKITVRQQPVEEDEDEDDLFAEIDAEIDAETDEDPELINNINKVNELASRLNIEVKEPLTEDDNIIDAEIIEDNTTTVETVKSVEDDEDDEDEDDLDDLDFGLTDTNNEERLKALKIEINKTIQPISKKIDLDKFTISKKSVSITKALKNGSRKENVLDWVMYHSGKSISIKELSADELNKLANATQNRNRFNGNTDKFNIIYDHIIDKNKFESMETWAKNTMFHDYDSLYFGLYRASFEGANHIPYNCPHCNKVFMSDNIDMMDMVQFETKKDEKEFKRILSTDSTTEQNSEYEVTLEQISDDYIIGFKKPSMYSVLIEPHALPEKILTKYTNIVEYISYIDSIYVINYETQELVQIDTPVFPGNVNKTVQAKVSRYAKILKSITSDQFNGLAVIVDEIDKSGNGVNYVLPAINCKHCNGEIKEQKMSPENMLFTRHQLTRIATM